MKNKINHYIYIKKSLATVIGIACITEIKASENQLRAFLNAEIPISHLTTLSETTSKTKRLIKESLLEDRNKNISELIGEKVVLNALIGSNDRFLWADMRKLILGMHKYDNPEQSFTQFDERHWKLISGMHERGHSYRLQYILAPGFNKTLDFNENVLHFLACKEEAGKVHLSFISSPDENVNDQAIEWLISGNNESDGVTFKNFKYNLYLRGSSNNKISLTPNQTDHGINWRMAIVDDYSDAVVVLKKENRNTSNFCDQLFCCFTKPVVKKPHYINADISKNLLNFTHELTTSMHFTEPTFAWKIMTNKDSTLTLRNTNKTVVQGASTLTATLTQQKDGNYPPIGLYTANKSNKAGQSFVAIPVKSGKNRYYMYLQDSVNDASLPLALSLYKDKIVLAKQNVYLKDYNNSLLEISPESALVSVQMYSKILKKGISRSLRYASKTTSEAAYYRPISKENQQEILTSSGVFSSNGILANYPSNLNQIAEGSASTILSTAQKWSYQQYSYLNNEKGEAPMCTIAWYAKTSDSTYNVYVIMVETIYNSENNSKNIVRAYNPIAYDSATQTMASNYLTFSSLATEQGVNETQAFPIGGYWEPVFI